MGSARSGVARAAASRAAQLTDVVGGGPASQTVSPNHIASTLSLFNPTVVPGAVVIQPVHISSTAQVFSPTILRGAVFLLPAHIPSTTQFFSPTIVGGVPAPDAGMGEMLVKGVG